MTHRKPMLIGLAGRISSGKDTVGGFIKQYLSRYGISVTTLVSFAEPLKKICQEVYAFTNEQMTDRTLKEMGDIRYPRGDRSFLTPREAMQLLGTEWGRRCYPNTWSHLGMRRASALLASGNHVVFTDCRFVGEATAIRDAGGEVWRIHRKIADEVVATHTSETEMDTPTFTKLVSRVVNNDGTLEQLFDAVKERLY